MTCHIPFTPTAIFKALAMSCSHKILANNHEKCSPCRLIGPPEECNCCSKGLIPTG